MQNYTEILNYYKSLISKGDLFNEAPFTDEGLHLIDKDIENQNQDFFDLLLNLSYSDDFNYKSLKIVFNQLSELYWDLHGDFVNHQINIHENTPLFRFPIKFDGSQVNKILSDLSILGGISKIYWYLETNFSREVELGEKLMPLSYVPAYFDNEGYMRHIYEKLVSEDCLGKEFYNHAEYQVQKIGEFLQLIPSNVMVGLPIDYPNTLRNDNTVNSIEHAFFIDFFLWSNSHLDIFEDEEYNGLDIEEIPTTIVVAERKPLFSFIGIYEIKNKENDFEKLLFESLKESFKILSGNARLSQFRRLFKHCELSSKIEVHDSKKLVAIIKSLKVNCIIKPHNQYLLLMTNCFIEPNGQAISVKSLRGSKKTIDPKEENQLKNLFR